MNLSAKRGVSWLALGAAAFGAVFCAASPALAQSAAEEEETIFVTGSRIRGVEPVGSNVIGVDREEVIEAGAPSTGDLLREIPQIIALGASETASQAQNAAANATRSLSVNLRGIGSNATLLLLNGRRMPAAGTQGQITDPSVIPTIALERLEVVADGGSAIYGSDAVTGVVNMIARNRFVGQESAARYGAADGYSEYSLGHIAGFEWTGGRMMAALEYAHHSALAGEDRDFYTSDLRGQGGADLRSNQCSPGNIVVGGVSYAIPAGGVTPGNVGSLVANTRNLCDNIRLGDIIPELERVSFIGSVEQELNDRFTAFAEFFYSRREFELQDAPATANLNVTSANPFYVNPTGGTGPVTVQYNFSQDGGLSVNPGHADSWQGVVGLRYDITDDWQAEFYASHAQSYDIVERTRNLDNTPTGINAFLANPDPSVAFNPFSPPGGNNPATIAAIRDGMFIIQGDTALTVVSAQADGPLFSLPAGEVRLAVGVERRLEELGGLLRSGAAQAPVRVPSKAARDINAVYAEFYVPVLSNLDVSVAGRYEEYSDFGDTFNPKIGVVWSVIDDLLLRASWGTSFRAPGLAENDPRSGGYGLYGDTLPCNHLPPATTCSGIGIAGGNADLEPEEAETRSIGFDLQPSWLSGLSASVNYFNIDYSNQILALRGTPGLLTNPIYAPYRILNPTPQQVSDLLSSGLPINTNINPATVTYIQDGRRHNLGGVLAEGYDFNVDHTWDFSGGDLVAGFSGAYFTNFETSVAPGAAFVDVLNTVNFPQRFRGRAKAGWRGDNLTALAYVNYVNAYDQTGVTPRREIEAWTTVDLHLGWDFGDVLGVTVALDVSNAFDEDPPASYLSPGYDPQSASPIGRLAAISVRKTW